MMIAKVRKLNEYIATRGGGREMLVPYASVVMLGAETTPAEITEACAVAANAVPADALDPRPVAVESRGGRVAVLIRFKVAQPIGVRS